MNGIYPNAENVLSRIKSVADKEKEFSKFIMETLKPPAGPYSIFHHHGHFLERLQNVANILERMGRARYRITVLNERFERRKPKTGIRPGKPYPKYLQKISSEDHKLTTLMKLDNESLYIFGNLTLDQWAYTLAYSLGLDNPEKYDFQYLITQLQARTPNVTAHYLKNRGENLSGGVPLIVANLLRFTLINSCTAQ
ncbi:hypothetical protein COU91_01195 [Candidatus Saccharibacteria bacterium CG10_big_fil_rev_8_21_14_0_10_47_8]|nr:MAG: hypothetical protein COU91_01195 [Candidatus Saccharibacteria bacterium CG10_big_fil_rev_8_21_14_0_10_47_8]